MKVSSLIKGSICVLGLVGAGSLFSAPAKADQASATGSVVVTRSDNSSVSVSGELTLPSGMYFGGAGDGTTNATSGNLLITPDITPGVPGVAPAPDTLETVESLDIAAGTATAIANANGDPLTVEAAVAGKISGATTTFEVTSYINAVSGALD